LDTPSRTGLKNEKEREKEKMRLVTTHSAYFPNVGRILKRHGHYLKEDGMENYMREVPGLSLTRGKNLADLVVNAKKKVEDGGSGPCGRSCQLCGNMLQMEKVKDKDGKELKIRGRLDCRTVGAIYGMYCVKCEKVVYVGKAMNIVMERFNGHRADMKGTDENKPAFHFKKEGHRKEDMKVIVLEGVPGADDTYRIIRERWWINRMATFDEENMKR
jgi:hypothetical protein